MRAEIARSNSELIRLGITTLGEKDEFFTRLVTINFTYLDLYYKQTKQQAEKSFWVTVAAAVVGFGMVIAGVCLLYDRKGNGSAGYVTTASGALSQFIAAVFFYLYNRTILSMSQYHQKLVITQNVSLALKTAETLDQPAKGKAQLTIIGQLTKDVNAYLSAARYPDDRSSGSIRSTRRSTRRVASAPEARASVDVTQR